MASIAKFASIKKKETNMIQEMLQKEVLKSIRKGKIVEGIYLLEEFVDENNFIRSKFSRTLTSISRRLMDLERTNRKGLLDYEVYDRSKNRIVDDLLFLLDDVDSLNRNNREISSSEVQSTEIWVVVNGRLEEFNEEKQQDFLDKLGKALKVEDNVKIKQITSGSIHILLRLPIKKAVHLYKMIKEGKMQEMKIMDAYFGIEQSEIIETESVIFDKEITYEEIGFQLGLRGDEDYKNKFIERYKALYEENVKREEEQMKKIELNLNNQLDRLENRLKEKIANLNKQKKSISILEFMVFDSNNSESSDNEIQPNENQYLNNLISRKYDEIDRQSAAISQLEKRIESINAKLNNSAEIIDKDIASIKTENWKNKVVSIIEEIEKGFVYGYTQRRMNTEANKA